MARPLTAWTKSEVDAAKLRVRFDDAVRINVGTKREPQWEAGCVTAVKYTQDDIPAGYVAAYQVRMESTGQLYLCKRDKVSCPCFRSIFVFELFCSVILFGAHSLFLSLRKKPVLLHTRDRRRL